MVHALQECMGRRYKQCIYYMVGALVMVATYAQASLREMPGTTTATPERIRQAAAQVLSQAYQLGGLQEMTTNLAQRYVNESLSEKLSGWVGDAMTKVVAGHTGPSLSERLNDPRAKAEIQAQIAARLKGEIPKLAKSVVYDKLFQGALNDADPAAQKMVTHIVDAMVTPLNAQADHWAQKLYGDAMQAIDPYIKKQLQIGRATITLDATNIRGTLDSAMRLQTVTDMISGPLADAMGESTFGGMQRRIGDFLSGQLPAEVTHALNFAPDKIDGLISRGEQYLPSAQLDALKNKILALPLMTIPNEVYGPMLAGSAARHFVLAFSEWPIVNLYELKRGQEVTRVMIWQLKNKQGFNMSLGNLLDVASFAVGQAGGLPALGRVGKTISQVQDKISEVEKKLKYLEDQVIDPVKGASAELRAQVDDLKQALLDFQNEIASPFQKWVAGTTQGLAEGRAQIKNLLPDGFNGIPPNWDKLKDQLGIPDNVFGAPGDQSILDHAGITDAAKQANDTVSQVLAKYLVDGAQALLPKPKISLEEKIPAQNPDENGDYDPVLLHNGEFTHPVVDVTIPGRGLDFQFQRIYRSRSHFLGRLGWQWTHNFEEALQTWDSPQGPGITWVDSRGRKYFFKARSEKLGEFVAPEGVFAELRTILNGSEKKFELRERGGFVTRFNRHGFLQEKCDRFGNCLKCERDGSGRLIAVADTVGRRTVFLYDEGGRITQMTDPGGRVWHYIYDGPGDLTEVVAPATDLFPQGITTTYYYEDHRMTQIRDPKGRLFLKNVYGTAGFARGQIIAQSYGAPENIVKSRYVLLKPAWLVKNWTNAMNIAVDRVDLRDRRGVVKRFWHNASGNLLYHEIVDAKGRVHPGMRYTYNDDGMRIREQRPSGLVLDVTYSNSAERLMQGLPVKQVLGGSRIWLYEYAAPFSDLIKSQTPDDRVTVLTYDRRGSLSSEARVSGDARIETRYRSNDYGQIISMTDPRGTVTDYVYDGANRTSVVRDARGLQNTTHYAYDIVGNITAMTLPNGGVRAFSVDAQNLIRREVTPLGYERHYDYDAHGNVTAMHVGDFVYRFDYDILDRLILRQEPVDAVRTVNSRYAYDADGHLSEVIFPEGNRMRMTYDALGNRTVVERGAGSPDASFTQYQYDADGQMVGVVDGLGHLIELERNAFSETIAVIYPNRTRQEIERDAAGRVVGVTWKDSAGTILASSKVERDVLGLSERELNWDSQNQSWRETRRQFDPMGNVIAQVAPSGARFQWHYDALGNRVRADYPVGLSETWHYNELGLPLRHIDVAKSKTEFSYDLQGRPLTRTDPNTAVTKYTYDERDNLLDEILPEGASIQYHYDGLGRRTQVARGERVTTYDWDGNGRLNALMDPLGRATRYAYDDQDRLVATTYPDGGVERLSWDAGDQVLRQCRPNSHCTAQRYDAMGNLLQRQTGNIAQSYQYDALGRMVSARENAAVSQFVYSSLSEVVASSQGEYRLQKYYDANGHPTAMQFSDGKKLEWQRDGLGRITQVDGPGGFRVMQTWTAQGPEKITYGNSRSDGFAYDAMGNVTKYTSPLVGEVGRRPGEGEVHYRYNLLGNLISQNASTYSYDPWQQLVQAGATQWKYTLNGERTQTAPLKFDKNGNMTSDGQQQYVYDALDRLQEIKDENGQIIARYAYDALNRRVSKITDHTTQYHYDGWEPVEIFEDGKLARQFVRGDGLDEAFGTTDAQYFHRDRLGSVVAVSDKDGKVLGQSDYEPFGVSSFPMTRGFTGQIYDAETGFYYMRNRYYSPQLGQFLTRDPLGYKNTFSVASSLSQPFSFSFHKYLGSTPRVSQVNQVEGALIDSDVYTPITQLQNDRFVETNLQMYVGNNPLNVTDPLGLYRIVVNRSPSRDVSGSMTLFNNQGASVASWEARTVGVRGRARGQSRGDTPNGIYRVTNMIALESGNSDPFRYPGRSGSGNPRSYGLGYIGLAPKAWELGRLDQRPGLAIHGGGSSRRIKDPFAPQQKWVNTYGCVRMQNEDVMRLVTEIHQLNNAGDTTGWVVVDESSSAANHPWIAMADARGYR